MTAQDNGERLWPMWRTMESAPRDGTPVLLKVKDDLSQFGVSYRNDALAGVQFVGRNRLSDSGKDYGWNFAAPVGYGGIPDDWLDGFQLLPPPPGDEE